jgi:hypothetical protein
VRVALAHSISPATSRIDGPASVSRERPAASATSPTLLGVNRGSSPPTTFGQKKDSWRSAALWKVRACTPPTPSWRSRPRISPAARAVNVTARTCPGAYTPAWTP